MSPATLNPPAAVLRPAAESDIDAVATIWHRGWRDAHLGHIPDALLRHRRRRDLRALLPARLDTTTVATIDGQVVGFVTVHDDEIEQIYVDAPARGTGVAAALLTRGEVVIGTRFARAWLAVVAGNTRARRFYERHGWFDAGSLDKPAPLPDGTTIPVPTRRYEKCLTATTIPPAP